jgi:hypothetical protein
MALGELLDQIRDYYVGRLVDAVNEHSAHDDTTVAHECAFRNSDGNIVTEGQLDLPARGDIFEIRAGAVTDSIQIDTEGMLSFEPLTFEWPEDNLSVDLGPFQWNWIQLRIYGLPRDADWKPLREWFMRWFHDEDPAADELLGGVHFMSDPENARDYVQVSLDLGTAPVGSLEELLDAVARMRAKHLQIGQFAESK